MLIFFSSTPIDYCKKSLPRPMDSMKTCLLSIAFASFVTVNARNHIVGDSMWTIPPSDDFYSIWSNNKSFVVGEALAFKFETGLYDVVQVSRREYESCSSENSFKRILIGPATVSLDEEGMHHFICSFGNYCLLGQKVSVPVQRPTP